MFKASKEAIYRYIVEDLSLDINSVAGAIELFLGGATVPFVARYRKERTGGLNETQLRNIQEKMLYYAELEKRKETVLESINIQGRLTDGIRKKVIECREKHALEDLYLPFKPKRQTKASIAVEKGLSALAETIIRQMPCSSGKMDILESFVDTDKGVNSASEALSGALDIVTEAVVDDPSLRGWLRERMAREGLIATRVLDDWKGKKTKYEMYYNFREPLKDAAAHRLLAVRRGANERIISWNIEYDRTITSGHFEGVYVKDPSHPFAEELKSALRKALIRMSVSIEFEMFDKRLEQAEEEAIKVFSKNLENLLLEPPAGHRVIMGVDPGFVTGCKIAVIDDTGKFIKNTTVFPNAPQRERSLAARAMLPMIREYGVNIIAVGNGTASRETMDFIKEMIKAGGLEGSVRAVLVSEAGASVYSASEAAVREFPELDVTVRGAISIARRLQDPLAELVKIDPKSIGVGQYQHDVNQSKLKRSLDGAVETCVNYVGVELNTASKELLSYVSGIGPGLAENIVTHRQNKGAFRSRRQLLEIPMLGEKAFEQCAGFLRIRSSEDPLDNSAIHPESYHVVEKISTDLSVDIVKLIGNKDLISRIRPEKYVTEEVGMPTLQDIIKELYKPGLDPRREFANVEFRADITDLDDLKTDMKLFGKVTNVTAFGAFVDIGVHQDGLIHISRLAKKFIKDPHEVISVGERVRVRILSVDTELKRIELERLS